MASRLSRDESLLARLAPGVLMGADEHHSADIASMKVIPASPVTPTPAPLTMRRGGEGSAAKR